MVFLRFGDVLAVVPVRPGRFQWLLSCLPQLLAAVVLLVLAAWLLAKRGRVLKTLRASERRGIAWVVAIVGASILAAGAVLVSREVFLPSRAIDAPRRGRVSSAPWPTFMGGARRTGAAVGTRVPETGRRLWTFCDGLARGPFGGSPAVCGDRVYVGSDNRRLYCLNAFTGRVVWQFRTRFEIFGSPVVAGGRVYLGEGLHSATEAKLHALDASTGAELWSFQTTSHIEFGPTLRGERLYVGAGDDGVYCLDAKTGRKLWQHREIHVDMSPAVTDRGVFVGSAYGRPGFRALDPATGDLLWHRDASLPVTGSPSTDGERVWFALGNGDFEMSHARPKGAVWCLSTVDGTVLWQRDVPDAVLTTLALVDGRVYFGSRDGRLYCADAATGDVRWSFDTGEPVLSSPAVAGGRVVFGCDDGTVYCLDAVTGDECWRYDTSEVSFATGARVLSSPALALDRVYVGSMNAYFFCIGEETR